MAQRDRHGRASHADNDGRRRPASGFRVAGTRRFSQLIGDAVSALPSQLTAPLRSADLAIEDVPPIGGDTVVLAHFATASPDRKALLTVYQRPLETRAETRADLEDVIRVAVGEAVARALGITDIDGLFDDDW